jgi:hypothetical protein
MPRSRREGEEFATARYRLEQTVSWLAGPAAGTLTHAALEENWIAPAGS